ncbi:cytochrome C [Sulfurimonas lithotrophica]|uniref:Cytochrome C n=1 Tax=Sulfurimonas lithotrophica TaxID=2590022 RepID=A0A5P8P076_9BACT|nr:cytochrome C [Sulfurimonas lithotrophica]QFR49113.1 cytochrome C [Sulfurimonas lithotrophica]
MKKAFFIIISIFFFTVIPSQAALYKGQKVYSKVCMKCHTNGEAFVSNKKQKEWNSLMKNKGKKLAELHLISEDFKKEKQYQKYKKYFEGNEFKKKSKHLKQFLVEYAKDSGNVPACN